MSILCGEINESKTIINKIKNFESNIKTNKTNTKQYISNPPNNPNNSKIQQLKGRYSNKVFPIITKKLIPLENDKNEINENNNSSTLEIIDYPQNEINLESEKHEKFDSGDTAKNRETLLINKYDSKITNKFSINELNSNNIKNKEKSTISLMSKFIQKKININYSHKNFKNTNNIKLNEYKMNNLINSINNSEETSNITSSTIIMNSTVYFSNSFKNCEDKSGNKQKDNPTNNKNNNIHNNNDNNNSNINTNDELFLKYIIDKINNNINNSKLNNPKKYHKNLAKNSTNFSNYTNNDSQCAKRRINTNLNVNEYSNDIDISKEVIYNDNLKPKDISFDNCAIPYSKPYIPKINSCLNLKNNGKLNSINNMNPNAKSRFTTCVTCRKYKKVFHKNIKEISNQSSILKNLPVFDNNTNDNNSNYKNNKISPISKNNEFDKNNCQNYGSLKTNKELSSDELSFGFGGKTCPINKIETKLKKPRNTIYNCKKIIHNPKKNKIPKIKSTYFAKKDDISLNNSNKYIFDLFLNKVKKVTGIKMQNPFKQNLKRKNMSLQNKFHKTFNQENKKNKPYVFYFHENLLTVPNTDILDSSTTDNNTNSDMRKKNPFIKSSPSFEKTGEVFKDNHNILVNINIKKGEKNLNNGKKGFSYSKYLTNLNRKESKNRILYNSNTTKYTDYKKRKIKYINNRI